MKKLVLLAVSFLLTGCGGLIASQTYKDLKADEIKAVYDSGSQIIGCLGVGGPPVGGRTVLFIYPRNASGVVSFLPDCQIKEANVDLNGAERDEPIPASSVPPAKPAIRLQPPAAPSSAPVQTMKPMPVKAPSVCDQTDDWRIRQAFGGWVQCGNTEIIR